MATLEELAQQGDPGTLEREDQARQLKLMKAGVMGEPNGPPQSSPEIQELFFDIISRVGSGHASESNTPPMTIQWDFTDAEPWHVVVANGSSNAARGPAAKADVTLRMSLDDFGDVIAERADPRRLLLKRRVRVRGKPRMLLKLPAVFGG